ncbi:MAG: hypothetical protein V1797_07135 [Pseudomonadota bacterium]
MRSWWLALMAALLMIGVAAAAGALTAEEVLKLKQAGVSDATIQKMLAQERQAGAGAGAAGGPVSETSDAVTYGAGQNVPEKVRQHEQRERMKEEKSLEMLKGIIVDQRQGGATTK